MASKSDLRERRTAAQMHALAAVRRDISSHDAASRSKYLREFQRAFQHYDAELTSEQVNERLNSADVLLIGDYHALPASQRFAGNTLEMLARNRPVALGIEAVLSRDQNILDAWWRREISEEVLRRRLRFDREWGYEWEPFYALLVVARENAEGIYGLDCMPRNDLRRIRSRDRHSVAKIKEMRQLHPNALLVMLFGESHMAPQHLPAKLKASMPAERVLTVLQNLDSIYWTVTQAGASAVTIGDDVVCVFNSSPLEKYESYRLCLEKWNAAADDQPDFAPAVYNLILSLARTIGFRLDSPRNGTQPRFLTDSLPEVASGVTPQDENAALRFESAGCAYAPVANTFYIREFQALNVAAEATRFLTSVCRRTVSNNHEAQAVEDALCFFGSRLLCPNLDLSDGEAAKLGGALYDAYTQGRITKPKLRRLFMTPLQDIEQARTLLEEVSSLSQQR